MSRCEENEQNTKTHTSIVCVWERKRDIYILHSTKCLFNLSTRFLRLFMSNFIFSIEKKINCNLSLFNVFALPLESIVFECDFNESRALYSFFHPQCLLLCRWVVVMMMLSFFAFPYQRVCNWNQFIRSSTRYTCTSLYWLNKWVCFIYK